MARQAERDSSSAKLARTPGIPFGRYQLLAPIGRGGMAEIWRARLLGPASFSLDVVIKRILPHLSQDSQFGAMFTSEAILLGKLKHPNIVQVFEFSSVDDELYIAMEHVAGLNLVEILSRSASIGPLPIGMGIYVVREICRALAYAHTLTDEDGTRLQLIHRDVSPSNVMVASDGRVKLLDFGIAKALSNTDETTKSGVLKGKLGYMSPEVVLGEDFDNRTDLFSAGVVLHELLSGARLFKGRDEPQTMQRVAACNVAPPSRTRPEVSSALDAICLKALARDRELRYASADEMARALTDQLVQIPWDDAQTAAFLLAHDLQPSVQKFTSTHTASLDDKGQSPTIAEGRAKAHAAIWPRLGIALVLVGVLAATAWRVLTPQHAPAVVQAAPVIVDAATPAVVSPTVAPERGPPTPVTNVSAPKPDRRRHRRKETHAAKPPKVDLINGDILELESPGAK